MNILHHKHLWLVIIALLVVVGALLRLVALGSIPGGMTWDEAAIGYNGWSVWTIHRDEWLQLMPISFRSFGDYKAPLAEYVVGPFMLLFGITPWSVRLPFALSGIVLLTIWSAFLIWLVSKKYLGKIVAVTGVAVLVFSPWHIHFSRIGFESGLALTLVTLAVFLWLLYTESKQYWWLLFGSISAFSLSLYAYHSAKIVTPLLVLVLVMLWWKPFWQKHVKALVFFGLYGAVTMLPLAYDSIRGAGATRAGDLLFLANVSFGEKWALFMHSVSNNLQPAFLLFGKGENLRHVTGFLGPLTPGIVLVTLVALGLFFFKKTLRSTGGKSRLLYLGFAWFLIGLFPALFSTISPHANRALLALPGMLLVVVFTLDYVISYTQSKAKFSSLLTYALLALLVGEMLWIGLFIYDYSTAYPKRASKVFFEGYLEAMQLTVAAEKKQPPFEKVENFIISSKYGQPYIYILIAHQIDPISFHNGRLVQYLFPDKATTGDLMKPNTLLLYTPEEEVDAKPMGVIADRWGEPLFYWVISPSEPKP